MIEVSVIMCIYNLANPEMLKLSIGSILNQSYRNFELIICDDASTDNTLDIVKNIVKENKQVKIIRNTKNLKAGGARNKCLEIARGKYVAIMDADDYSVPERLKLQKEYLDRNPSIGLVGGKGRYFNEKINDRDDKYWYVKYPKKKDFLFVMPFVHASIMFRKKILDRCGGYSEKRRVQRAEDYEMLMRIYSYGYKGANLSEVLYYIRENPDSIKKRKYRYRFNECYVKICGFKRLGLMPMGIPFVIKPLLVGMIPFKMLTRMQRLYYKQISED